MKFQNELSYLSLISEQNLVYRFVTAGLDLSVVHNIFDEIKDNAGWMQSWMKAGQYYDGLAERALDAKHTQSAGELFMKAALSYHYAQFLHFTEQDEKSVAQSLKLVAHAKARPLVNWPIERLEAEFEGAQIPILFRTPKGKGPFPVVIMVCGTDSTKEEHYGFDRYMLERGFATVGFDGPGQGEVWPKMKMRPDYHKVVSLVADAIARRPEVDAERMLLLGKSFGGLLAPDAAARDKRFKACVVNGGYFDTSFYDWSNPLRSVRFQFVVGAETVDDARERAKEFTLKDSIGDLNCPLLVIHGGRDRDCPASASQKIVDLASGPSEFVEFPTGIHCCHNVAQEVYPLTADWLADRAAVQAPKKQKVAEGV